MKKIVLIILCFIMFVSCQSQQKTDLEKVDFSKGYKEVLKDTKYQTEAREIVTTLPIAYTKDVAGYKFGNISFPEHKENKVKSSTVGLLINNPAEKLTKGIKIEWEDTAAGNDLLAYLKSQYKNPKVLAGIPAKNSEGKILGNAAYLWDMKDKTMVLVQYYEYTNNKPNTSSVLYIVDNQVKTADGQETAAAHLVKTYTP
ncbi:MULTISPECIES: hypothetical protein [unclassified Chryseobacterium]|uniref:hypothetical protein n=1 Tax=unclassified Chryseobacterium TaxID=2593645 RepID=UPI001AE798E9|nr:MULTISPECIES: hypothetical protein [unclassified Chryseobacterium]MBP1167718.1 hypothetical protein [Chryseobacterium sp. PvR013]MDR4892978.1 hypothetical protein [Chryseobacterium sp. CFS7]